MVLMVNSTKKVAPLLKNVDVQSFIGKRVLIYIKGSTFYYSGQIVQIVSKNWNLKLNGATFHQRGKDPERITLGSTAVRGDSIESISEGV